MTKSLLDAAKQNELVQPRDAQQGTDRVYTTMTQFLAAAATAYVVMRCCGCTATSRTASASRCWPGAVSRWRWLFTAVASALIGSQ